MQQQERRVRPQLAAEQLQQQQQQQQPQKCPRCDSLNTKFCYYNNYSLSQPRYFCKTCRRYWTQGGTLRNVPVGGGCRKGKRSKKPSSSSSSSSSTLSYSSAATAASTDSGFHHSILLPPQQSQQDSILVATSAASASPLRNVADAIAATASGCSSTSPSASLPYYGAGGGGFFSSLIAMQSYNHAINAADFAGLSSPPAPTTSAPFNHALLTGFNLPLHHQQQRIQPQPAGFQMGGVGVVERPLQQLLMPTQSSRSSAGVPPASFQHQEWPPQTIAPDGGYWQSNVGSGGGGGPPSSGGHWPDLQGFGPSSSSSSFL